MLFLCFFVSLDDCIVHCLWQSNHLRSARCALCKYICSLAVGRVHSIQPKALKASAFSLSYRVLGRLHRPLPVAVEPPFGLHAALSANTFARLLLSESTQSNQKHSKRVLFLCLIVSLDDCIVHCLWQSNHLSVCTLRFMQIHLLACCWASPLNGPKALKASAFSLPYRVLGLLYRLLPVAGEPPFGLHAALCANTFARLLLGESTHWAKSTQSECFFFALSCPWTIVSPTACGMQPGGGQGGQAPPSRP